MSNSSKSDHLKLYLRLKQQECITDKSLEAFVASSKVDSEQWHSIKRDADKLGAERQKITDSLKETASNIYGELKSVKAMVKEENLEKIDLQSFKTKLQSLWKQIEEFKHSCHNSTSPLVKEQAHLEADLNASKRVIRMHKDISSANCSCKNSNLKTLSQKEEATKNSCNYDDVEDFCTLLAKTGHTGNWTDEDHILYLQLRKKHKSSPALVAAIQAKCPDLTEDCILGHEAWYKTYLGLREKQKAAVQEWRQRKETERLAKISTTTADVAAAPKAKVEPARSLAKVAEHKRAEVERKRELVRQWREQRLEARAAEEERLRSQLRARRELGESRRRARTCRMKRLVAEHKRSKELMAEEEKLLQASVNGGDAEGSGVSVSSLILQIYRARDQQFLEKRKKLLSSKMNEPKQQVPAIQYDFSKINESTLFKETIAWQEKHRKVQNPPKTSQTVSYIKDLPKRAIGSWRSFDLPGSSSNQTR